MSVKMLTENILNEQNSEELLKCKILKSFMWTVDGQIKELVPGKIYEFKRQVALNLEKARAVRILEKDYFGIDQYNPKTKLFVKQALAKVFDILGQNESIRIEQNYRIYECNFGDKENKNVFLFANPFKTKSLGQNQLYLRPLKIEVFDEELKLEFLNDFNFPERNVLEKICKEQRIPTTEGTGEEKRKLEIPEVIEEIAKRHQSHYFLFTETSGVAIEDLNNIESSNWKKILSDYLNGGIKKDPRIEEIYKSDLPQPNPELIEPQDYMPYNSNEFVFTNSKTTKTSTAEKTGVLIEKGTPSNLLGFSTANEVIEGSLNGETKQLSIDEVQEDNREKANYGPLSSYMEKGKTENRTGKQKTIVRGYAGLRFQGNPKTVEENTERPWVEVTSALYQQFSDTLTKVSTNNEAIGGRIGYDVFRTDLQPADTSERLLSRDEILKNEAIVETVFEQIKEDFTQCYFNEVILNWLNKEFDNNYKKAVLELSEKVVLPNIKDFLQGHAKLAYKHLRGKAFKLAIADKALEILQKGIDEQELLELSEEYCQVLEQQNLESFANLVDVSAKEKTMKDFCRAVYEHASQQIKILLECLRELVKQTKDLENAVLLENLKEWYNKTETQMPTHSEHDWEVRLTKDITRSNNLLKSFGVEIVGDSVVPKVLVKNKKLFKELWEGML